jgi:hypothetical protein
MLDHYLTKLSVNCSNDGAEGLESRLPEAFILKLLGVDPKARLGMATGDEFGEDPFSLLAPVDHPKVAPTPSFLTSGPLGTQQVGKLLFSVAGHGGLGGCVRIGKGQNR